MRVPLSWLREYAALADRPGIEVAAALIQVGFEVERVESVGTKIDSVVVARVGSVEELNVPRKQIRYVSLDDGGGERWVICGAANFGVGDLVPYARPPATLPGGRRIEGRRAYGRHSDGMICSPAELGLSDDHSGILVLPSELTLGADVVAALQLRDEVLDIAVTPDRGYALSVRGLAREAATAFEVAFRDPADLELPGGPGGPAYQVRVEDPVGCDRYVARTVSGLDPHALSPLWLQRRLTLAGMRPISLPVDVTNYVLLDLGQPLHAFDGQRLEGAIVVRRAQPGEKLTTLDEVVRDLDPDDLVIADGSGPIALAGVMGGGPTEVSPTTTELVIEAAHFDPASVARTARRHRLSTEASRRFERGVDDALAPYAAQAAVGLLVALGRAEADSGTTDVDARQPRPVVALPVALPGRLAGRSYPEATVRRRLGEVGCAVTGTDEQLRVTPPPWRPDLRQPIDLVEEVVRLEGYDTLPARLPQAPAGRGLTREQRLRRRVSRTLAEAGFVEVLTYPFVSPRYGDVLLLPDEDERRPTVRVANPLAEDESVLRATLLPGLLAALARNVGRGLTDLALYETGVVFRGRVGAAPALAATRRPSPVELSALEEALPRQPRHLGVVLAGAREPAGWWGPGRPADWADAVEAVRVIADVLQVHLDAAAATVSPWHPGRCAALAVAGQVVGHAGELHPRVVAALGLPARTCAAELNLEPLLRAAPETVPAPLISPFPVATLDVAVVVDERVPVAEVAVALRAGAGDLLESLRLFDVYRGPQVGAGRRSLAFALRLRAADRTLTVEEATNARDAAVAEAARRTGAQLRGA